MSAETQAAEKGLQIVSSNQPVVKMSKSKMLKVILEELNEPRDFEVGDLVTWKDEIFRNAIYPKSCMDFGICVRFEDPVRGDNHSMNSQFCDWKDVVLGVIDKDGDYSEFMYSSRRMKKFFE